MLFSSSDFIFYFLPITLTAYWLLSFFKNTRLLLFFITAASLFFYAWWKIEYIWIILISIGFNFGVGRYLTGLVELDKKSQARLVTILGIIGNLIALGYYKYAGFFSESLNAVFGTSVPVISVILPIGISFFTFQQIAYLADVYSGKVGRLDFLNYTTFVTFFPQLIAGPIVHHKDMMPQFVIDVPVSRRFSDFADGMFIFLLGLGKKMIIADTVANYSDALFTKSQFGALTFWEGSTAALAYTVQIYFDFSGYSDMAVGLALMFSINLIWNFDSPYKSIDIVDFWRRWHISLSNWLRDYLYIPLGGNRKGDLRRYANLLITMVLGGLWHGASWTFVIWGTLHGVYLLCTHAVRKMRTLAGLTAESTSRPMKVLSWLITFILVVIAWVFFRAVDANSALNVLSGIFGLNGLGFDQISGSSPIALGFLVLGLFIAFLAPNTRQIHERFTSSIKWRYFLSGYAGAVAMISFIFALRADESPFLYFNF